MLTVTRHREVLAVHAQSTFARFGVGVYAYALDGVLIDSGPNSLQQELAAFYSGIPVEKLLLTHAHEDHSGMASWLEKHKTALIMIHPDLSASTSKRGFIPMYRQFIWGASRPFQSTPCPPVVDTGHYTLQAIETPGHAPGHLAFFEKTNGWLFGGDLFIGARQDGWMSQESVPQHIQSLQRVLSLDFDTLFSGHAGIVSDAKRVLSRKLAELEELRSTVLDLVKTGLNPRQINRKLFPAGSPLTYFSQGDISTYHLIRSICEA
ncbi:MAG: MBL fold metallo-hydrolase [Solirubrobacterales bacterium]